VRAGDGIVTERAAGLLSGPWCNDISKEIIRYNGLRKSLRGRLLLDIGSLAIHEQRCMALSGRNGAGKSTLMRIIAGLESPDSLSVKEISRKVPEALDWAGIAHLQLRNARELSGSERQRVAFADASHDQATQARRC